MTIEKVSRVSGAAIPVQTRPAPVTRPPYAARTDSAVPPAPAAPSPQKGGLDLSRDGLPPELLRELDKGTRGGSPILELLLQRPLTLEELLIAFFRKHGKVRRRQAMVQALSALKKQGLVEKGLDKWRALQAPMREPER